MPTFTIPNSSYAEAGWSDIARAASAAVRRLSAKGKKSGAKSKGGLLAMHRSIRSQLHAASKRADKKARLAY